MDWRQELKHNITTAEELRMHIPMSDEEFAAVKQVSSTYPMSIPLYYLALIDKDDPQDPIRGKCVCPPPLKPIHQGVRIPAARPAIRL